MIDRLQESRQSHLERYSSYPGYYVLVDYWRKLYWWAPVRLRARDQSRPTGTIWHREIRSKRLYKTCDGRFRDGCLAETLFISVVEVRIGISTWMEAHNGN